MYFRCEFISEKQNKKYELINNKELEDTK